MKAWVTCDVGVWEKLAGRCSKRIESKIVSVALADRMGVNHSLAGLGVVREILALRKPPTEQLIERWQRDIVSNWALSLYKR